MLIIYVFVCSVLFVSSEQNIKTTLTYEDFKNKTSIGTDIDLLNKTKLSFISEGGTLLPKTPDISLPKSNVTSYLSLDEDLDKSKEKSSVPRKGVDNLLAVDSNTPLKQVVNNGDNSVTPAPEKLNTVVKNSSVIPPAVIMKKAKNKIKELEVNQNTVHKKPTILSYEALANMEKNRKSDHSRMPVPSSKTMASSQIPSPIEDSIVKVYPSKANSHPGMIMPIVITILVVPMFAIVGYMALKRGQEAWKNRHYKRMDFLLDGMYND